MEAKSEGRFHRAYWPTLNDATIAKKRAREAGWFAVFVGSVTALVTILNLTRVTHNLLGFDAYAFVDAGMFLVLSIFMFRMSRIAFVLALLLYLAEQAVRLGSHQQGNLIVAIIFVLVFVNGLRGAFVWHRLTRATV